MNTIKRNGGLNMFTADFILGIVVGEALGLISAYIIVSKEREAKKKENEHPTQ